MGVLYDDGLVPQIILCPCHQSESGQIYSASYGSLRIFRRCATNGKAHNLQAGVITPDPYEPIFQEEDAAFLSYYGVAPIACRPARPQDKGKVEVAIRYVKQNFLKSLDTTEYVKIASLSLIQA